VKIISKFFAGFFFVGIVFSAVANEPIKSAREWRHQGFSQVRGNLSEPFNVQVRQTVGPDLNALLPWPVSFWDSRRSMGNVMAQFQNYGGASYWHGGCDLRTAPQAWIQSPVSGRVEAGYYGYETKPDGSMNKWWNPWPANGESLYFEVAVIDEFGTRFEFHHINRDTLTPEVLNALQSPNTNQIPAGTRLGKVMIWPVLAIDGTPYHHTHYNVIQQDGRILNPEAISTAFIDTIPPRIHGAWIREVGQEKAVHEVSRGQTYRLASSKQWELIVGTTDQREDDVHIHMPSLISLTNDAHEPEAVWDFTESLQNKEGKFPDIREALAASVISPSGRRFRTSGNYSENFFLVKLPLPTMVPGARMRLNVQDQRKNTSGLDFILVSTP
jgi:hypothetical protein